jgi:type II secretory pathway component PulK
MKRRGFALLTVLWLIAALAVTSAAALSMAKLGAGTSRNRIVLARAEWAREACIEIMLARYAQRDSIVQVDRTDLGGGLWCRVAVEENGSRLDLNLASPEALRILIGNDSLADALLARRAGKPFADVAELGIERLRPFVTTRGTLQVDVNAAPPEVLATLPGITPAAIAAILSRREVGRPIRSADELASLLPRDARAALLGRYQDFTARAAHAPSRIVVGAEGGVGDDPATSVERLTLVPLQGRLAVIRREVE